MQRCSSANSARHRARWCSNSLWWMPAAPRSVMAARSAGVARKSLAGSSPVGSVTSSPLLTIKSGDDVTDPTGDDPAKDFRATPAERAAITDLGAAGIHHSEFEHHLARCRAEFAEEQRCIDRVDRSENQLKQQTEGLGDDRLGKDCPRAGAPAGPLRINRWKSSESALRGSRGGQTQGQYENNQRYKHDDGHDEVINEFGREANPKPAIFVRSRHAGAFLEPLHVNRFARGPHPAFANGDHFLLRQHLAALPAND